MYSRKDANREKEEKERYMQLEEKRIEETKERYDKLIQSVEAIKKGQVSEKEFFEDLSVKYKDALKEVSKDVGQGNVDRYKEMLNLRNAYLYINKQKGEIEDIQLVSPFEKTSSLIITFLNKLFKGISPILELAGIETPNIEQVSIDVHEKYAKDAEERLKFARVLETKGIEWEKINEYLEKGGNLQLGGLISDIVDKTGEKIGKAFEETAANTTANTKIEAVSANGGNNISNQNTTTVINNNKNNSEDTEDTQKIISVVGTGPGGF